ncbi:MAG: FKBP-type peptidyl-prolyl cis-trans isomerase [bacterium]
MKYIGIIVIVCIIGGLVFAWIKTAPQEPAEQTATVSQVVDTTPEKTDTTTDTQKTDSSKNITNKKIIKTKDGMTIEILKEGTGEAITNGKTANMLYTGTLADGTVFDSTDKHGGKPYPFILGVGHVIKGWDEGVLGMKVGEQRKLTIPYQLAYGENDYGPIPGKSTLIFTVELVSFE